MKKILVIRLGAIGDVVLASAPILNLKLSFPQSRIYLVTRERTAALARLIPGLDEIITLPTKISPLRLFQAGEELDQIGFDVVCDLHGNLRSRYLARHISAPEKVQYHKRRLERVAAVRRHQINPDPPHTIDLYNSAVKACGGRIFVRRPLLRLPDRMDTRESFDNSLPAVAVASGASYPTKQWFPERFEALVREIIDSRQGNVFLLLSEKDAAMRRLSNQCDPDRLKILFEADLIELAHVISQADLLLSNDSGLAHIGSAVGTPVIALFGPTHPTLGFAPRGLRDVVLQVDEPCRPCSLHGKKACYREERYCFSRISTGDALATIARRLTDRAKGDKALFIDRDGTLIKEKNFLSSPGDVELEDGAVGAVKLARAAGYKIVVVSNQSGVARGFFGEKEVAVVNSRIRELFERAGAPLDDIYYCPYYSGGTVPEYSRESLWRKPAPGMVEAAAREHNINPFCSWVIGDKLSDIRLAYACGARSVLVRTGFGRDRETRLNDADPFRPERIVDSLPEAVKYVARVSV